jgi:Integrase core domain
VQADRGSSMTAKPVAFGLADLGVTKTHSRPHVANDNPYSESQFKTLKYRPGFPDRFGSIQDARAFLKQFFGWETAQHRHSGSAMMTPEARSLRPRRSAPPGPRSGTGRRLRRPSRALRAQAARTQTPAHRGVDQPARVDMGGHSVNNPAWRLRNVDRFRAVGLVVPLAGAKPKPVKPGQFVTYTCATGERAGSGTVAWFDKDGRVISISTATAAGATLTAGPAPARARSYEFRSVVCSPPNIHLTGSLTYPTDGEPRFLYVVDNSDAAIFGVPSCPSAFTTLDYAASTIVVPNDVSLINQLDSTGSSSSCSRTSIWTRTSTVSSTSAQ